MAVMHNIKKGNEKKKKEKVIATLAMIIINWTDRPKIA